MLVNAVTGQGGTVLSYKEEMHYYKDGEAVEQAFWSSDGCPISVIAQGQVVWSFGQPDLVEDDPAHGRKVGTR